VWRYKKQCQNIKELQANNTDVDFIFISMDKTADKWKVGIEKHQLRRPLYGK
jgi:hypothetical protein